MASLDIRNLRVREELLDGRNGVVADIFTFGAPDHQRGTVVRDGPRLTPGKICHALKRVAQDRERDAEFHRLVV